MRFLVDENVNYQVTVALRAVYGQHEFRAVTDEGWSGLEDIELFTRARASRCAALIRQDKAQLRNERERGALRSNRLHWVGYEQKGLAGIQGVAVETATVIAGLAYVISEITDAPMAFRIKGIPSERGQRISAEPV
ncbi:MAG: hypothetical protein LBD77_10015 [Bifidobacteriaceae bacterium]|jgi:hypothetical protein|nr:hypothetical protein [Bifidobacteriaceae bacterium]